MFKRILIPLDGSHCAEQALPVAARIARSVGGSIVLLRIVSTATQWWPALPSPKLALAQTAVGVDIEDAKHYLAALSASAILRDIPLETEVFFGPVASTLLESSQFLHCDLVIMCSSSSGRMTQWISGGVVERILRYSPLPLLLLRDTTSFLDTRFTPAPAIRILVPLDGSVPARAVLYSVHCLLASLTMLEQCELHLLAIVKQGEPGSLGERKDAYFHANEYLRLTREHFCEVYTNLSITSSVAMGTNILETFIDRSVHGEDKREGGPGKRFDLIALASRLYSSLQSEITGNVAEHLWHATAFPLFVIHPSDGKDLQEEMLASGISWDNTPV